MADPFLKSILEEQRRLDAEPPLADEPIFGTFGPKGVFWGINAIAVVVALILLELRMFSPVGLVFILSVLFWWIVIMWKRRGAKRQPFMRTYVPVPSACAFWGSIFFAATFPAIEDNALAMRVFEAVVLGGLGGMFLSVLFLSIKNTHKAG